VSCIVPPTQNLAATLPLLPSREEVIRMMQKDGISDARYSVLARLYLLSGGESLSCGDC
jgi:hypothetical protein